MAKRLVEESSLTEIADAIRSKGGTSEELVFPNGFKASIEAIQTDNGGIIPEGTLEINENGTYDVANYESANVNVPTQSSDGGIVPSGTIVITENGTYDITNYANANVAFPEVSQATPSISVDSKGLISATSTQEEGLVPAGTKSATLQLSTQAASTITPGTSDKTAVSAGKYTTGEVTVKGDSNLVPGNIKSGVSIFGIIGNLFANSNGGTLITKTGTTTAATFDTGLSEILAVVLRKDSVTSVGFTNMSYIPAFKLVNYGGCSNYSTYNKMYAAGCINDSNGNYCVVDGGSVSWLGNSGSTDFIEGDSHTWYAIGYE